MKSFFTIASRARLPLQRTAVCLFFAWWGLAGVVGCSPPAGREAPSLEGTSVTDPLTVALYPYVPNLAVFQTSLSSAWSQVPGAPPLTFVEWDCYSDDPPADLDVFVFDGIFLSYFANSNFLRPMDSSEINDASDFIPYSIESTRFDTVLYGIPQIGCTNILYYRSGDEPLAAVQSLTQLWTALGPATYTTAKPPPGIGFMMDFSGGTTDACSYIVAEENYQNNYSQDPPLPPSADLDPNAMNNLHTMVSMAGTAQASWSDAVPYQRAIWFNEGSAQAMVGFSEAMSQMDDMIANVRLNEMPMSDGAGFSLFYVDIIGVNKNVVGTTEETWAMELANLMASHDYITTTFDNDGDPQYLFPVRWSVLSSLGATYARYQDLDNLVKSVNPVALRLGVEVRTWLANNKDAIRTQILGMTVAKALKVKPPKD